MTRLTLNQEQVREVLARAEEIEQQRRQELELTSEVNSVIAAAQEVGISREAIVQAMQEHIELLGDPPKAGDLVFAKSANEKFYAAQVQSLTEAAARVRYLNGGEQTVGLNDIRPLAIVPGAKLICNWPDWGPTFCRVISYSAEAGRVKVSSAWGEETFNVADVRLDVRPENQELGQRLTAFSWQAALLFTVGGGVAGSLITWLLHR